MTGSSGSKVSDWFGRNTLYDATPSTDALVKRKHAQGATIGVCLPALNEEATIRAICSSITSDLVRPGLVDQLVVMDSGSTDKTSEAATLGGATVFKSSELLAEADDIEQPGKGDSLWKSLSVLDTDLVVWLDADTKNFVPAFVTALVTPLIEDPHLVFAKAFYDRPLEDPSGHVLSGGARVTEIAIRPLLNLLYPELAGFIQPLSGEYAGRRTALMELPFGTGYDVDLLMLIEIQQRFGLDAIVQVDLGRRVHRNRDVSSLGRMSFEIMRMLLEKLDQSGLLKLGDQLPESLVQFANLDGTRQPEHHKILSQLRPPMRTMIKD